MLEINGLFQNVLLQVVGPPGTGKTDVAVQIISNLYHNFPDQRTLIVTHSNQVRVMQIIELKIYHSSDNEYIWCCLANCYLLTMARTSV